MGASLEEFFRLNVQLDVRRSLLIRNFPPAASNIDILALISESNALQNHDSGNADVIFRQDMA